MSVELKEPRSRRALLAGLAGAAGAFAASALGRPSPLRAGTDGDVVLNADNSAAAITSITIGNSATAFAGFAGPSGLGVRGFAGDGGVGLSGQSSGASGTAIVGVNDAGVGVKAQSNFGKAVWADSQGALALLATSNASAQPSIVGMQTAGQTGVHGHAGITAPAPTSDTGVLGTSEADLGTGVWGQGVSTATSNSVGVTGQGDTGVLGSGTFGVVGATNAPGIGVYGSASNSQIPSVSGKTGVIGQTDAGGAGVVGFTGSTAPTPPPDTGIYGRSNTGGANGRGLTGFCSVGIGLLGQTDTGVGVRAFCGTNTGVGLRVTGKAAFDRSGKLTISAGHSSLTKTGIGLTSASFILATLQTNVAGLSIQAVVTNPSGSSFTIYLNKAPAVSVAVAWLAVN